MVWRAGHAKSDDLQLLGATLREALPEGVRFTS
jgi:LysR family hydrogen peroxide-inducible transcriptional activator